MPQFAERFKVRTHKGRVSEVEALDFDGNVLCKLPTIAVEQYRTTREPYTYSLVFAASKFEEEQIDG